MFCSIVRKTTKSRLFNAIVLSVVLSLLLEYMEDVPMADALKMSGNPLPGTAAREWAENKNLCGLLFVVVCCIVFLIAGFSS